MTLPFAMSMRHRAPRSQAGRSRRSRRRSSAAGSDWRRLAVAIQDQPWGSLARQVEAVLTYSRPYGIAQTMERVIARSRDAADASERQTVATEVDALVRASGLSRAEFASRIGTSPSRLSTYVTGKVTPSAALLVRMRRISR